MEPMELTFSRRVLDPGQEFPKLGPFGKTFGHVLGCVCPKTPQIMEPMGPTFSRRVLDPG